MILRPETNNLPTDELFEMTMLSYIIKETERKLGVTTRKSSEN